MDLPETEGFLWCFFRFPAKYDKSFKHTESYTNLIGSSSEDVEEPWYNFSLFEHAKSYALYR